MISTESADEFGIGSQKRDRIDALRGRAQLKRNHASSHVKCLSWDPRLCSIQAQRPEKGEHGAGALVAEASNFVLR